MKLSRRQSGLMLFLVLSITSFGVDHFMVPRPAPADARQAPAHELPPPASGTRGEALTAEVFQLPAPATSRDEVQRIVVDVFAWSRVVTVGPVVEAGTSESGPGTQGFSTRYVLRGTVFGPEPAALIGRRKMHLGEKLEGCTLKRIDRDEVEFVSDAGDSIVLRVPGLRISAE